MPNFTTSLPQMFPSSTKPIQAADKFHFEPSFGLKITCVVCGAITDALTNSMEGHMEKCSFNRSDHQHNYEWSCCSVPGSAPSCCDRCSWCKLGVPLDAVCVAGRTRTKHYHFDCFAKVNALRVSEGNLPLVDTCEQHPRTCTGEGFDGDIWSDGDESDDSSQS